MRIFSVALLVASLALVAPAAAQEGKKLNVLFIAVDDLRPELSCYGAAYIKSPNIDALAAQGLRFDRAYCQLALCNPSRASLLAGRRPETIGVYDLKTFVRDAAPDVVTLPELFKKHGYESISIGKIFHTTNGNHEDPASWSGKAIKPRSKAKAATRPDGYVPRPPAKNDPEAADHAFEPPYAALDVADEDLSDGRIASAAIKALNGNKDRPFFLAVGFHKPHLPFVAPKKYWDLYDPATIELPPNREHPKGAPAFATNDASELRRYKDVPKDGPAADEAMTRSLTHGYYACVSYIDAQIGRVLAELDRLKLRDNTAVIFFGDHGYHLSEQGTWNKRTNWELATRVPLIVSAPAQKARGQGTVALAELVDVYPTLVELCGLPRPQKLEGTSVVPLLDDPARPWKFAAFSVYQKSVPELGGRALGRAMRTSRYRLIEWRGEKSGTVVRELYDHENDPRETVNLAASPENAQLIEKLASQLRDGPAKAAPPATPPVSSSSSP